LQAFALFLHVPALFVPGAQQIWLLLQQVLPQVMPVVH